MQRRYFIAGVVAAAPTSRRAVSANDKVTIAVMGLRGRAPSLLRSPGSEWFLDLPDVRIPMVCDVDQNVIGPVMKMITEWQGKEPKLHTDIRRILDDKSVDAIVMATPIHWHAAGTILACDAGKDVYVEKPASHNVREGRLMIEAARRNNRIVQLGTQSRSRPQTERFIELVKSGKLGRVLMVKVGNVQKRSNIGHKPDESVPPGIDYDTWTGPVLIMPFNRNRFHGTVNWHWHYGCGDIGNDGVHFLDIARWALDVDYPLEVTGMGRKLYFDDDQQTPDTMNVTYNYKDKVIHFEQRLWNSYMQDGTENSVIAYGSDGMAIMGRWEGRRHETRLFDSKGKMVSSDREPSPDYVYHARNFIDCVKSRKRPNAEIEIGVISSNLAHLGNIAARTGRTVRFDPKTETIPGDQEMNRYVTREYRSHWSTPRGV